MGLDTQLQFKRSRVFFYHYNKPMSQQTGLPTMSLHVDKMCYMIRGIICNVNTYTHENKTQPRMVIKGNATVISIIDGIATIN